MVAIILDTNIWISFIAKDNPSGILEELVKKRAANEIVLLSNEIIINEWKRNKDKIIKDVSNAIKGHSSSARKIAEYLKGDEKNKFTQIIDAYNSTEAERIKLATERVQKTEDLLLSCVMTPVTDAMKLEVVNWALEKRAPFKNKSNSVGDALIILSAVEYWEKETSGVPDSIFVTFNHDDFSKKDNHDEVDDELKELLDRANMKYTRNIGEALKLTPELLNEIESYFEYQFQNWIDLQVDIARGK